MIVIVIVIVYVFAVVTRWYRPPELMLCPDGLYTFSVDMWSVGNYDLWSDLNQLIYTFRRLYIRIDVYTYKCIDL